MPVRLFAVTEKLIKQRQENRTSAWVIYEFIFGQILFSFYSVLWVSIIKYHGQSSTLDNYRLRVHIRFKQFIAYQSPTELIGI